MKKILNAVYLFLCLAVMLSINVHAYLDPSVSTMIVQVVAGIAVAAGAVVTVVWRRAKKKVQKALNIDENAKKEVEEEVQFDEDDE